MATTIAKKFLALALVTAAAVYATHGRAGVFQKLGNEMIESGARSLERSPSRVEKLPEKIGSDSDKDPSPLRELGKELPRNCVGGITGIEKRSVCQDEPH